MSPPAAAGKRHALVVATVLVDGENVRRSRWPNVPRARLVEVCAAWAADRGHEAVVVFDVEGPEGAIGSGAETADEWIARRAGELARGGSPYWLVTSDRALREIAGAAAERIVGGGSFLRELG
jgi:predicted RNA-binding protein with PIN domain